MIAHPWIMALGGVFMALAACWWLIPWRSEPWTASSQLIGRIVFPLTAIVFVIAASPLMPRDPLADDLRFHAVVFLALTGSLIAATVLGLWRLARYYRTRQR